MGSSSYDPRIVFDDIYGEDIPRWSRGYDRAMQSVIAGTIARQVERSKIAIPVTVTPVPMDIVEPDLFEVDQPPSADEVLGEVVLAEELPLFARIRSKFSEAMPKTRRLRVDTLESYPKFREALRRLEVLERAFAAHVADGHGAFSDQQDVDIVGAHIDLAPRGKVACWQSGPVVLCSVCLPGMGGPRVVTSGSVLASHLDDVCRVPEAEDLDVVVPLAQLLAGRELRGQICRAAVDIPEGDAAEMRSATDPSLAAAMSVLQRCQRGDEFAVREARMLESVRGGRELMSMAAGRLAIGQSMKQSQMLRKVL